MTLTEQLNRIADAAAFAVRNYAATRNSAHLLVDLRSIMERAVEAMVMVAKGER